MSEIATHVAEMPHVNQVPFTGNLTTRNPTNRFNPWGDPWTRESEARLAQLWPTLMKLSEIVSTINSEFGKKFSPSAICGKACRLHLTPRAVSRPQKPKPTPEQIRAKMMKKHLGDMRYRMEKRGKPEELIQASLAAYAAHEDRPTFVDVEPSADQRKTIYQLGPHDCRWPYGDPVAFFCGGAQQEGSSYCTHHKNISVGRPR